jgi:hypothetical protein
MAKDGPACRVDRLPVVDEQLRTLAAKAGAMGIRREYLRALHFVLERLRSRPMEWGDPGHRTRKQGGWVCHGICRPLVVHYVVFEPERVFCILKTKPLSGSHLE